MDIVLEYRPSGWTYGRLASGAGALVVALLDKAFGQETLEGLFDVVDLDAELVRHPLCDRHDGPGRQASVFDFVPDDPEQPLVELAFIFLAQT